MASQASHKRWMKVSALAIAGFGPILTLGTMPGYDEPARSGLDPLTWPLDRFPSYEAPEIWFLSALTGGFLVGWGVGVWCLSIMVHDTAPEPVRRTLRVSADSWFVPDSLGSITSGNWPKALRNVPVLLRVMGPMWRPASD